MADAARQLDATPEELRDWEWRHLKSRLDDSISVIQLPSQDCGLLPAAPDGLRYWAMTSAGLSVMNLESGKQTIVPLDLSPEHASVVLPEADRPESRGGLVGQQNEPRTARSEAIGDSKLLFGV